MVSTFSLMAKPFGVMSVGASLAVGDGDGDGLGIGAAVAVGDLDGDVIDVVGAGVGRGLEVGRGPRTSIRLSHC